MNVVDEVTAPLAHSTLVASTLAGVRRGVTSSAILLTQFHVLSETAGGTSALRKLILNFAIRGGLSTREPDDDSVTLLLAGAQRDRQSRLARGDARQMEELGILGNDEVPFALPHTWAWTRIGHAMNLVNGRAFKPNDWSTSGLPIVRIQNLNNPSASFNYCAFEVEARHHLGPGDFLISWSGTPGTSFGAFIWNGPKGVLNQHIFRGEIYAKAYELGFLRIAINARLDEMIAQAHGGVGLQHITKGKLEALAIPLPPLAEQKRIVAKVEQLMSLCDELEARQTKKRDISTRLTKSALESLTTAEGPEEFDIAWKRVVENFDVLTDRAEKMVEVRRAIVDLAVRGKLVEVLEREGTAVALLAQIERARRSGDVLGRSMRSVDEGGESLHPPFAVPANWTCARLADICLKLGAGSTPLGGKAVYETSGVKFLRSQNIWNDGLRITDVAYIAREIHERMAGTHVLAGDILLNITGASIGRAALVPDDFEEGNVSQHVAIVRLAEKAVRQFVHLAMVSSYFQEFIMEVQVGVSREGLSMKKLQTFLIPLPPLAEQQRIVARVDQLMTICDELEAKLARAEERASRLVEAVVRELVA